MKVVLLNGSPRAKGNTYLLLSEVEKALREQGVDTKLISLGNEPIRGCIACTKCKDTSKCIFDDCVNRIADQLAEADGIIVGSPVYYAGMAGQLKCFLDRLFYSHGKLLAYKPAAAVVCARRGGATATFDEINKYFAINCMPIVSSTYWNQGHGCDIGESAQDVEGMQVMRMLGRNMAWLLKCIECGKQNGIARPEREPATPMNFIR